ncbi:unnamed protein product [Kluyveromyces dobzhanskii CBS 2104]|uniref:WGS project CCBQ000000000 data, contig 00266 n=1 Tax=Kluyveromyces dobzhanskii CBS 2104 TaxID=1427455 RepID=A0A0A8L7A4_9SACH|nr:unnamed protein product [Kluyveromyces dobzhanskii CBS 2104]
MNFIRTLFDNGSNEELLSLSGGEFVLLRSFKSPKSSVEYIFSDAMICVKRCGDYEYLLRVERQDIDSDDISDGDSDDLIQDEMSLLSGTSKKDDTWTFKIMEDIQFVKSWNADRHSVFIWNNTKGDDGDQFEYVIGDSVPLSEIEKFYKLIKHCTYEAKYRKSSDQATRQELLEFMEPDEIDDSPIISDEDNELRNQTDSLVDKNGTVRLDTRSHPSLTDDALGKLPSSTNIFNDVFGNSKIKHDIREEVADTYDDDYDEDDVDDQSIGDDASFVDALEYNSQ